MTTYDKFSTVGLLRMSAKSPENFKSLSITVPEIRGLMCLPLLAFDPASVACFVGKVKDLP